jgi:hypothetical protein
MFMTRRTTTESIAVTKAGARLSLRSAALARWTGKEQNKKQNIQLCSGLMRWQPAPGFGEPSFALRGSSIVNGPSSLERGSAATRTVVRSISLIFGSNELTHISKINRR